MRDVEKLKKLLNEFEIPFSEELMPPSEVRGPDDAWRIEIQNWNKSEKVGGYFGFIGSFEFDENGKFLKVCLWE